MAEDSGMMTAQFLIAPALDRFARSLGWKDHEYVIYYKTNPDWGRIHILFIAQGFNDRDEHQVTNEVWAHLQKELHDEPEILKSINLVVRSKKKVEEGGLYAIGSAYQKYWPAAPLLDRGHGS